MTQDLLDDQLPGPVSGTSKKWWIFLLINFLVPGLGLFYIDKTLKRSAFYMFCAVYSWAAFANIFLEFNLDLREFHNHTPIGGISVYLGWVIAYIAGSIDGLITLIIRKRKNRKR